jgi:2-keto-4-pentenoate hydratase/2-oxohepta-3-ene-1,7-dioic acid hydratase in catechol pathway
MKLCRFRHHDRLRCGFYSEQTITPIDDLAAVMGEKSIADAVHAGELENLLPTDGPGWLGLQDVYAEWRRNASLAAGLVDAELNTDDVELLPPIARPSKLLLLAGNYAEHVREQGDRSEEAANTFPYVFMKPPSTTLAGHKGVFKIPRDSAGKPAPKIDHEIELAVIIGTTIQDASLEEAAAAIAGYSIINDISDRGFHPNENRIDRPRDKFFDWLHGKWHNDSCPCGPCLVTADEILDPQSLAMTLTIDAEPRQSGSTADQVFSVAETIAFISKWVRLEPGDILSTGTPKGVGNASGRFLEPNQQVICSIEQIGSLQTTII